MSNEDHRLAAIMFTDIVGYSQIMSQDEQSALDIGRKNREIQRSLVNQHGGQWVKDLGDGALAMFPTAWSSVQCAKEIQQTIKVDNQYQVRIGIHLGDITIENDDAFGDGVNIASRIESRADSGGIYISESVYKAIRGREDLPVKDLGELDLKNIAYPIRIYALIGEGLPIPGPTPESLKPAPQSKSRRVAVYASAVAAVMLLGWILFTEVFPQEDPGKPQSIAVIPFVNLSEDPKYEYLMEGLHDAIIGRLGQLPDLRVISRTSTLRYLGSGKTIPEIAQELGVDNIVEATILGDGHPFRMQIQLIRAFPQETHIWSQEYQPNLDEILDIQNEIALQVGESLAADTGPLMAKAKKIDPEVYKLYLRGMHQLRKGESEAMLAGMEYLTEAVELDPTAAFAYAGLAQGYVILGHSRLSEAEHFTKAKAAANQALQLDNQVAEAWSALADVKMYYEWDFPGADEAFKNAIELNPNLAAAHAHYTWLHVLYGRDQQALYEAKLTVEIDPFAAIYTSWLAWLYWLLDMDEQAILWAEKTIELNPELSTGYSILGCAYADLGVLDQAIPSLEQAVNLNKGWSSHLSRALILGGRNEEANMIYENALEEENQYTLNARANLAGSLGLKEETLKLFAEMIETRSRSIPWIHRVPFFEFLHDDPEFQEICRQGNIPFPEVIAQQSTVVETVEN